MLLMVHVLVLVVSTEHTNFLLALKCLKCEGIQGFSPLVQI